MPANFTSGWLGNGEAAWHGQGVVTEGTLPAREAFETADALFSVEKRELHFPKVLDAPRDGEWDFAPSGTFAVVRTDTQAGEPAWVQGTCPTRAPADVGAPRAS